MTRVLLFFHVYYLVTSLLEWKNINYDLCACERACVRVVLHSQCIYFYHFARFITISDGATHTILVRETTFRRTPLHSVSSTCAAASIIWRIHSATWLVGRMRVGVLGNAIDSIRENCKKNCFPFRTCDFCLCRRVVHSIVTAPSGRSATKPLRKIMSAELNWLQCEESVDFAALYTYIICYTIR